MRRACRLVLAAVLTALAVSSVAAVGQVGPRAKADPPPPIVVTPVNPRIDEVGIAVTQPGHGGGSSGGTQTVSTYRGACDAECRANPRSQALFCGQLNQGGIPAATWASFLQAVGCAAGTQPAAAARPPTAAELAVAAYGRLRLPAPVPARYPTGTLRDGRSYTIVQTYMWFWSSPATWKPLSKRVCAGALCATARAAPMSLSFGPGNGEQGVSCPGPGTAWERPPGGSWIPTRQPQGCEYRYTTSTFGDPNGELTATYTITWQVSWTGTNGTSGRLNPLTTRADSTFAVAELQSVVTR
jgi:hypothetical protein